MGVPGDSNRDRGSGVRLVAATPELRPGLLALEPNPGDEEAWTGYGASIVPAAESDPTRHLVAIVAGGVVVGMLTLDWGPRSRRYAAPSEVGLHGFLIDRRQRRRGFARGALAALPAFARRHHPAATAIALTVNERNAAALAAYRGAGFVDHGERFLGGGAGPQHVLRLALAHAPPRS